jgi:hypothetical protein
MALQTQLGDSRKSTRVGHFPPSEAFAERPCGSLPLPREDRRRVVVKRTMRTHLVVVLTPSFQFLAHIRQRKEHLYVQTFIAQPAVE